MTQTWDTPRACSSLRGCWAREAAAGTTLHHFYTSRLVVVAAILAAAAGGATDYAGPSIALVESPYGVVVGGNATSNLLFTADTVVAVFCEAAVCRHGLVEV